MHPQLQAITDEFESARAKLRLLARDHDEDAWQRRPAEASWSAAECVAHLNLTSLAYLELLEDGLRQARQHTGRPPARFRRDFMGWLIWRASGPDARMKVATKAAFVPGGSTPRDELVAEFDRLQDEQLRYVTDAGGLAIQRVRVASPFDARVRYSLYSALTILPAHQHRHLQQAERALKSVAG